MTYAHAIGDFRLQKHYTNAAVKLFNCFVQQANILARLQGVLVKKLSLWEGVPGFSAVQESSGGAWAGYVGMTVVVAMNARKRKKA